MSATKQGGGETPGGGGAAPGWILPRPHTQTQAFGEQTRQGRGRPGRASAPPGRTNPRLHEGPTYPDLIAADLHVADRVSLVGPAVVAAELADGHLLGLAVVQAVGVVLGAAPGPHVVRLHQEMAPGRGGLLQVGLDVGLATRGLAPQTDLLGRQRRAPTAKDAVQDGGGLLQVEGVELLHDVGEL